MVASAMSKEEGEKTLPYTEAVAGFIEGKTIVKAVFVPGRLLNLVVK